MTPTNADITPAVPPPAPAAALRSQAAASEDLLSIREMCDAFDVTPRTLRFYEAKELIRPIRQGTRRLYTRRDRARLTLILRGKRFGFSLEDIRQTLDLYDREGSNLQQLLHTHDLARERLGVMEAQRDELIEAIAELKEALDHVAGTISTIRKAAE